MEQQMVWVVVAYQLRGPEVYYAWGEKPVPSFEASLEARRIANYVDSKQWTSQVYDVQAFPSIKDVLDHIKSVVGNDFKHSPFQHI